MFLLCFLHVCTYGTFMTSFVFCCRYGPVSEVWLDGNKSPATADMNYLFDSWFAVIHQLQPNANIFSDAGPDVRWIGDEAGEAGITNWSMMNRSLVTIGGGETE
jgi:alpha-L-fucosidase